MTKRQRAGKGLAEVQNRRKDGTEACGERVLDTWRANIIHSNLVQCPSHISTFGLLYNNNPKNIDILIIPWKTCNVFSILWWSSSSGSSAIPSPSPFQDISSAPLRQDPSILNLF